MRARDGRLFLRRLILPRLAVLLPFLIVSCGDGSGGSTGPDPNAVAQVNVSAEGSTTIPLGGTLQLEASLLNSQGQRIQGQTVSWSSQDSSIAEVDPSGLVTGVGVGSTQIRATAEGTSGQITVTVHDPDPPAAPSNLEASVVSNAQIDLTWTDNSTNEDEFRIEREAVTPSTATRAGIGLEADARIASFTEVATVGPDVTSYSDTELAPEQEYRYRIRACNENGCSSYTSDVGATTFATLVIETETLPAGTEGVEYSATLSATGGSGPVAWSVIGGALPSGLTLSTDGVLAGTPTETGTFPFTVQAESGGQTVGRELVIEIGEEILPPVVTTSSLPDGMVGEAYSAQLEASRGDGSYAWALTDGALPDGLSLGGDGAIEGTPSAAGTFSFTLEVTSAGLSDEAELSITIEAAPVEITTTSLPDGTVGAGYSRTLEATGGDGVSYQWSVVSGQLPSGLSLEGASGEIAGTPEVADTFEFTVRVESGGKSDDQALVVEVAVGPVSVTTTGLPDGVEGTSYSATLEATGGDGTSYSWSVTSGSLPGGLSLDGASGEIAGTPSETGTFDFTVQVESGGETDDQALSITVDAAAPVAFENWYLPAAINGDDYTYAVEVSGGDGTYGFSVVAGDLPPGLSLGGADGTINGTPSQSGTFFFEVEVESSGTTATRHFALSVSTAGAGGYNIAVVNASGEIPSAAVRSALDDAVEKWEAAITTDLTPFTMPDDLSDDFCQGMGSKLRKDEVIEDLAILLDVQSIDGAGGTLARAGPCGYFTGDPLLPRSGSLVVDSDDADGLDSGQLLGLVIHEMGHVVGIGTLWDFDDRELIVDKGGEDPRFVGSRGVAEYKNLGGSDDDIPVEDTGGEGTRDAHWRNSVFDNEVMTGFISEPGVDMPLSLMSIESVADLSYSVNGSAADPYSLPSEGVAAMRAGTAVSVGDDIAVEPYLLLLPDGTVQVLHPPR